MKWTFMLVLRNCLVDKYFLRWESVLSLVIDRDDGFVVGWIFWMLMNCIFWNGFGYVMWVLFYYWKKCVKV